MQTGGAGREGGFLCRRNSMNRDPGVRSVFKETQGEA